MGSGPARSAGPGRARALRADRLRRDARTPPCSSWRGGRSPTRRSRASSPTGAGVRPDGLTLLIAPTASIAGCVQVAARSVETGLHKMLELGFDVRAVRSGLGVCPLAPVAKNDLRAIGWTNDCILYGTRAYFAVQADDAEVAAMVERLPAVDVGGLRHALLRDLQARRQRVLQDRPRCCSARPRSSSTIWRPGGSSGAGRLDPRRPPRRPSE